MMLRNHYGVDMCTGGLVLQAQSHKEFFCRSDRQIAPQTFVDLLTAPCQSLADEPDRYAGFKQEMRRFLPAALVTDTVEKPAFWQFVTAAIHEECQRATHYLLAGGTVDQFKM